MKVAGRKSYYQTQDMDKKVGLMCALRGLQSAGLWSWINNGGGERDG